MTGSRRIAGRKKGGGAAYGWRKTDRVAGSSVSNDKVVLIHNIIIKSFVNTKWLLVRQEIGQWLG